LRSTAAGWDSEHGSGVERLDGQLALHLHAAVVEADSRDIVPGAMIGEGKLAARTVLADAIDHVDGLGLDKEVVWIDAAPFVTTMTEHHALGDRTVAGSPCGAMCEQIAAVQAQLPVAGVPRR
jgi:hypothetical protein